MRENVQARAGGPARGWVLSPEDLPPLPTPRFLHKMENSTGNFRAETPQGEQSQAGRVGTPPPHWPSCSPTRLRALPAQSPDRVCEAQAGWEFPVASWLAWCLALGRPGYRVCQGVSTCPCGHMGQAGAANAACVDPKCFCVCPCPLGHPHTRPCNRGSAPSEGPRPEHHPGVFTCTHSPKVLERSPKGKEGPISL